MQEVVVQSPHPLTASGVLAARTGKKGTRLLASGVSSLKFSLAPGQLPYTLVFKCLPIPTLLLPFFPSGV